jgi:hypothetical protein
LFDETGQYGFKYLLCSASNIGRTKRDTSPKTPAPATH